MKNKKKLLKAMVPMVLMGTTPIVASTLRSGTRMKNKKSFVSTQKSHQSKSKDLNLLKNPFNAFQDNPLPSKSVSSENRKVLSFLEQENLLNSDFELSGNISGDIYRKSFLGTTGCIANAQYNLKDISRVSSYSNWSYFIGYTSSASGMKQVSVNKFKNAKSACVGTTITGVQIGQTMDDNKMINPFANVILNDVDGDNLSVVLTLDSVAKGALSSTSIVSGTISDVQNALRSITFTPTPNRVPLGSTETVTFNIKVSDGTYEVNNNETTVIVTPVNDAPTVTSTPILTVNENSDYEYILTSEDADGNRLSWSVKSGSTLPSWLTFTSEPNAFVQKTGANNPLDSIDSSGKTSIVDIDNDGDLDVIVNRYSIKFYENENGVFSEKTGVDNPFSVVTQGSRSSTFVDIDGDGDLDAFFSTDGADGSYIVHYENENGTFIEKTGADNPLSGISEYYMPISLVDIDGDGDLDLIYAGYLYGDLALEQNIHYFKNNNGTFEHSMMNSDNPFKNILDAQFRSSLNFVDIDSDGDLDVFVNTDGADGGSIKLYKNENGVFEEAIGFNNPLHTIGNSYTNLTFADIDDDGDLDAFLAATDYYGGSGALDFYENNLGVSLKGRPTSSDVGEYDISLVVSDGIEEVEHNFKIVVKSTSVTPPYNPPVSDNTNPILSEIDVSAIGYTTATVISASNEDGKIYYIVSKNTTLPTAGQIIAGKDATDELVNISGHVNIGSGEQQSLDIEGLDIGENYTVYMVSVDANGNRSEVQSKTFTTLSNILEDTQNENTFEFNVGQNVSLNPNANTGRGTLGNGSTFEIELNENGFVDIDLTNSTNNTHTTFKINRRGSQTTLGSDDAITTSLTLDNGTMITTRIESDGKISYSVKLADGTTTSIMTDVPNSDMEIDRDGNISLISTIVRDGFIYKTIVRTDTEGNTITRVLKLDADTLEEISDDSTLEDGISYPAGSSLHIILNENKMLIESQIQLNNNLIIG